MMVYRTLEYIRTKTDSLIDHGFSEMEQQAKDFDPRLDPRSQLESSNRHLRGTAGTELSRILEGEERRRRPHAKCRQRDYAGLSAIPIGFDAGLFA
jgi:hypothetical protein